MFKNEYGDWTNYRNLPDHIEIDFHFNDDPEREHIPYYESMDDAWSRTLDALKRAYEKGLSISIEK